MAYLTTECLGQYGDVMSCRTMRPWPLQKMTSLRPNVQSARAHSPLRSLRGSLSTSRDSAKARTSGTGRITRCQNRSTARIVTASSPPSRQATRMATSAGR